MTIMSEEPFEIPRFLRSPNAPAAGKRLPKNSQFVLGDVKTRERTPQVEGKGARRMKSATIRTKMSSIFRGVIGVLGILASAALITLAGLILFNNNLSDRTERGADNTPTTTLALALIRSPSANAANASPDHEIQRSDWSNQAARLQPEAEINAKSAPTEPTAPTADGTAQSVSDAAVPQLAGAASPASPSVDSSLKMARSTPTHRRRRRSRTPSLRREASQTTKSGSEWPRLLQARTRKPVGNSNLASTPRSTKSTTPAASTVASCDCSRWMTAMSLREPPPPCRS